MLRPRWHFDIVAWQVLKADPEFAELGPSILNNFTVPSIDNEISWAIDRTRPFDHSKNFYEVFPGKIC
jgi:hypothetical protein